MIDSHCHLAGTEFAPDLEAVVARARQAGLVRCLVILAADDPDEVQRGGRVRELWPEACFAVGVHPHHAHKFAAEPAAAAALTAEWLDRLPAARAIGEIGLDYHYDFSPPDAQQQVFRAQLQLAKRRGLAVVIHAREAETDTLRLITEEGLGSLRGVFHCFTGDRQAAARAVGIGFHVSIPGIATFPKATELRAAAQTIPVERLLIETDSPYLAPVPHRGKRNEPGYVGEVLKVLAAIRNVESDDLGKALVENFDRLFAPAPGA